MAGPVVDTLSAQEFRREILDRITAGELQDIAAGLERKSAAMRDVLLAGERLDRAALRRVLRLVFAARRRADQILDDVGPERLAAAITDLLDEGADQGGDGAGLRDGNPDPVSTGLATRFDRFDAAVSGAGRPGTAVPGFDLASELLHFTAPGQYWLWTRWLWDPASGTGALALVTQDVDLAAGTTRGEVYLTVGRATAFVNETGKAAGFTDAAPGLFGADMFLAAVYGVYLFTVLRMRMTREFTQLVPPLPDLIRRLLGVYYQEASDAHRRA